ncbi:TetR/AcrR family transcriptional regulator [Antrihabitans cavernicola]|uniref:TetR/AcrR family transcriptional regulator n=1 Tax=Antrihabitans cavernicola TaxID=2495913 RepID=A0A5A7S8M3_9NOCA|nr:TetR/AcrR family transcriptional regulator [Spelaeibacter cavernicola]KAA0022276.1 TetR/AcrR family transcriptional regulator [Spelaeibacter cavernicola]
MTRSDDVEDSPAVDPRVVRTRSDVIKAAMQVLMDEGLEAVTHSRIAQVAGYSKATLYSHWPTRAHLIRDVFAQFQNFEHHTPTGDLQADLVAELIMFRQAIVEHRLDRGLVMLLALMSSHPELVDIRDNMVTDGERVLRRLLATTVSGPALEAAVLSLSGAVLHAALLHGEPPSDSVIEATVDMTLRGIGLQQ